MLRFPDQSSIFAVAPETLLEAFKRLETLLPKVIPGVISNAHKIQGDGGAGTIVEFVFAPDGRTLKMTTELFDEVNFVVHLDLQVDGDWRYSTFKLHMRLFPGLLEGTARNQWTFIYEPDNAPPPMDIIAAAHPSIVAFSNYLHKSQCSSEIVESLAERTPPVSTEATETVPSVCTELAESLNEEVPRANVEPAESLTESMPSANIEPAESLTESMPSANIEPAESLTESMPSADIKPACSLSETMPSASTEAAGKLQDKVARAGTKRPRPID